MSWHVLSSLTSHLLAPLQLASTKSLGALPVPHLDRLPSHRLYSLRQASSYCFSSKTLSFQRRTSQIVNVVDGRSIAKQFHMLENTGAFDESVDEPPIRDTGLIMYIVVRRDLWKDLGWPLGSVITQGCHAATAALWMSRDDEHTSTYCAPDNIDHMHKVVLEVKHETQLRNLSAKLEEAGVPHKLWVEQPEDFATCLATAPCVRADVQHHFKKLQLCKGAGK